MRTGQILWQAPNASKRPEIIPVAIAGLQGEVGCGWKDLSDASGCTRTLQADPQVTAW